MEFIDNMIVNTAVGIKALGVLIFKFVLKTRMLVLTSGLLFACVFSVGHSVDHPQNARVFTCFAAATGLAGIFLLVLFLERLTPAQFPEFDPIDHKQVPENDWFASRENN